MTRFPEVSGDTKMADDSDSDGSFTHSGATSRRYMFFEPQLGLLEDFVDKVLDEFIASVDRDSGW